MGDTSRAADAWVRYGMLAVAVPSYYRAISALATPGSPAWWWALGHSAVEAGLVARGVLPPSRQEVAA